MERYTSAMNARFEMWIRNLSTAALIILVGTTLFVAAYMAAGVQPVQDLAQYWSAAHLVRLNPYSFQLVAQFEHSQGIAIDPPLVLKNPPWAIPFFLPLGLLSYRLAFATWTLFSLIIVLACTRVIWHELNGPSSLTPIIWPLLFGPVIVQLMLGQWTVLVLLGITLFLAAAERGRDWIAGASLVLVLGKPHVALLFLIAVGLWSVRERRWRILSSALVALFFASVLVESLNPHIWAQFIERTSGVVHEAEAYPNLGGILYHLSGVHLLALIPELAGVMWLPLYWKKHRSHWNWWEHGTIVVLCSVVCSYYSYPYDEILALPALLVAFARNGGRAFRTTFLVTNLGYALYISSVAGYFGYKYMFLWWTASGWLLACILSQRSRLQDHKHLEPLGSEVSK
jgi:hypothetical protein